MATTKININMYSQLTRSKNSLKETSKDDSDKTLPPQYLSNDTRIVVDFDDVKTKYLGELELSNEYACSVDAFFEDDNNNLYLVEFKNGEFDGKEIKEKVKDSLLILGDITKKGISFTRENAGFILVVNKSKLQKLSSQQRIALHLARMGKSDFAIWGLNKLRRYCFKSVNVCDGEQFDNWVKDISII